MKNGLFSKVIGLALAALVAVGMMGCGKKVEEVIKIGAILCESGSGAEYGKDARRGVELATSQINERGGINGKRVVVLYENDNTDPKTAVSAAQKLISAGVQVIIGAVTSSSHLAISPLADKNEVVIISPGASNPNITNAGDFVFRNWISDTFEGKLMAEYLKGKGLDKLAIFYLNNDYGLGLKDVFATRFEELGGKLSIIDNHEQDQSDFRTALTRIANARPDAIYLPSYYKEMAKIMNQRAELGISIQVYSTVTFEDPKLIDIAGRNAEGVIYSFPYYNPNSQDTTVQRFVASFTYHFNQKPGIFAAHAYDATNIVFRAISIYGNVGPMIRDALYSTSNYPGVSGLTTFDKNGDVEKPVSLKIVTNESFAFLEE